jgi:hypothetical protein
VSLLVAATGCPAHRTVSARAIALPDGTRLVCAPGTSARVHLDGAHSVRDATGRRDGPFASFWPTGEPMARGAYVDGELDGEWIVRYQNGALRSQGRYQLGVRVGGWMFGDPDGRPLRREVLDGGEVVEESDDTYGRTARSPPSAAAGGSMATWSTTSSSASAGTGSCGPGARLATWWSAASRWSATAGSSWWRRR